MPLGTSGNDMGTRNLFLEAQNQALMQENTKLRMALQENKLGDEEEEDGGNDSDSTECSSDSEVEEQINKDEQGAVYEDWGGDNGDIRDTEEDDDELPDNMDPPEAVMASDPLACIEDLEQDTAARKYNVMPLTKDLFEALIRVLKRDIEYRGMASTLLEEVNFSVDQTTGITQCIVSPGVATLLSVEQSNKTSAIAVLNALSILLGLPCANIIMDVVSNVRSVADKLTRLMVGVNDEMQQLQKQQQGQQQECGVSPILFRIVFLNSAVKAWREMLFKGENLKAFKEGRLVPIIPGYTRAIRGEFLQVGPPGT